MTGLEILGVIISSAVLTYVIADIIRERKRRRERAFRVKIEKRLNGPTHCRVWHNGALVFEGESMEHAIQEIRRRER